MKGYKYEARTKDGIIVTLDTFNDSELTQELRKQVISIPDSKGEYAVATFLGDGDKRYYKLNEGELVDVTGLFTLF